MPVVEDYFDDFAALVRLCQQEPEKAELLRQQLIAKQHNAGDKLALLQYQFTVEQRLRLISSPEEKQLFIQQQLARNVERLEHCVAQLQSSCDTIAKIVKS
ncbi:MAG TPA: DUF3135 domain-containing protein [Rheinheimera sp.]|uniref:DUF3135 domain-containing protein n=1 Tax=Rheinheimera TaxID=67575 RepID=UPI002F94C321